MDTLRLGLLLASIHTIPVTVGNNSSSILHSCSALQLEYYLLGQRTSCVPDVDRSPPQQVEGPEHGHGVEDDVSEERALGQLKRLQETNGSHHNGRHKDTGTCQERTRGGVKTSTVGVWCVCVWGGGGGGGGRGAWGGGWMT